MVKQTASKTRKVGYFLLIGLLFIALLPMAQAVLIDDNQLYYSMDTADFNNNEMFDASGNGNNGTNQSATGNRVGLLRESFYFSSMTEYINASPIITTTSSSISTWVYLNQTTQAVVVNFGDISQSFFATQISFNDNTDGAFRYYVFDGSTLIGIETLTTNYTSDQWYHVVGTYDGATVKIYVDGVQDGNNTGAINPMEIDFLSVGGRWEGASLAGALNGSVDELGFWNRTLSEAEISELFNGSSGFNPYFTPAPASDTLNITGTSPANSTQFNTQLLEFNVTLETSRTFNVSLFINDTLNQTRTGIAPGTSPIRFNVTFPVNDQSSYSYFFSGKTNNTEENSTTNFFFIDNVNPQASVSGKIATNTTLFTNKITGQFNCTDPFLFSVNVTLDQATIFNISNLATTSFQFNLSRDISALSNGKHNLSLICADGHTAKEIESYGISYGWFSDSIKYKFDDGWITINPLDNVYRDRWTTKKKDRYSFTYVRDNDLTRDLTYEVTSSHPLTIVNKPDYKGWIIAEGLNKWIDFEEEGDYEVTTKRIAKDKLLVTLHNVNKGTLEFNSIGNLNIVQRNYTFFKFNLTEEFEPVILSNFQTQYNLTANFGNLTFNISGLTPIALLELNGTTNITATLQSFTSQQAKFTVLSTPSEVTNQSLFSHKWFFNLSTFTNNTVNTSSQNQLLVNITVGQCIGQNQFPILNISYFDEVTELPINVTNAFDLVITDGTFNYNQIGSFTGNTSNAFCTNLNPANATFSWDMSNTFTLSKAGFITRIIDIDSAAPILLSNAPTTNLSLFMIGIGNSTTVSYTWLTREFQVVDGTMRIFKCNTDGTQDLVESTPVISGAASANIQLLVQPYAYDIIIDGVLFQNPDSFSRCHIESSTEVTLIVDIGVSVVDNLIGLQATSCDLVKINNTAVSLTWGLNSQDAINPIRGCVRSYQRDITGAILQSDECMNVSGSTFTIPFTGPDLTVVARLEQANITAICTQEVTMSNRDNTGGTWGFTGLFGTFLLTAGMILLYAGNGEMMLVGGGIGLVVAIFLSIFNVPWIWTASGLLFLIIVAMIGRYGRKETQ